MIWIIIGIAIMFFIAKKVANWATKDIADPDPEQPGFNPDNVYYNNYTQGK